MMNRKRIGLWYIGFGLFLLLCGVLGYASNPAGAKTALISGGTFGGMCILWGILMFKTKSSVAYYAAGATTLLLLGAFLWRSTVTWQAVAEGEPKRFAAGLLTTMLAGSLLSLVRWTRCVRKRA